MRRLYSYINTIPEAVAGDYLFVAGGQSNLGNAPATGRVAYNLMPTYLQATQPLVKQWVPASLSYVQYTHPTDVQWGFINEFLYRVSTRLNKTIHFYKYGQGGTQITGGGPYPTYNKTTLKTNGLNAINNFKVAFPDGIVVFIWNLGFTDGLNLTNSLNYETNLTNFYAEMRAYWGLPNLLILSDELSNNATASTYRANVRAGQYAVDALLTGGVKRNHLVDSDDCAYQADQSHYSDAGSILLGQKLDTALQLYYPN